MKPFLFNLQSLLDHRKNLEEKARNDLARLVSLHMDATRRLADLQRRQHEALEEFHAGRRQDAPPQDFGLFCAYLERLRIESERARAEITELEGRLEMQKKAVIEATRRRKLLETLRSRKQREHLAQAEAEEQKAIDESVVIRYKRKAV